MAYIRPFRGIRYNPAVVGDPQALVCPPYDVISERQQALLHSQSPYNAIHLDLNQAAERYTTAAELWRSWREKRVLIQEPEPALYVYSQDFSLPDGSPRRRTGILAAVRLEEFASGVIRPHEQTFEDAKKDRLALLEACQAQLSPVFLLYARKDWSIEQVLAGELAEPIIAVSDGQANRHTVWRVTDPARIAEVAAGLAAESLIIADGHHRYETALRYCREHPGAPPDAALRYVLAYVTNAEDEGVVILPTHRLIHDAPLPSVDALRTVFSRDFRLRLYPRDRTAEFFAALRDGATDSERRIGCALAGARHYWLLCFDERIHRGSNRSTALRSVDVTVLHDVLLQRVLGFTPEQQEATVSYTSSTQEALQAVIEQRCQAAFFLNPTPYDQVQQVCGGGETMPHKSTYFYPKLLTGLVFYSLAAGAGGG